MWSNVLSTLNTWLSLSFRSQADSKLHQYVSAPVVISTVLTQHPSPHEPGRARGTGRWRRGRESGNIHLSHPELGFSFYFLSNSQLWYLWGFPRKVLIYNPYAPLNHAFHFIHQMLMVLQTPTSPIQGSHSGARNSDSEAANWWEVHAVEQQDTHMFYFYFGPCCTTCGISVPPARDRAHSLALETWSVNHRIAREVPLTPEPGRSGVTGKDWVWGSRERLGRSGRGRGVRVTGWEGFGGKEETSTSKVCLRGTADLADTAL